MTSGRELSGRLLVDGQPADQVVLAQQRHGQERPAPRPQQDVAQGAAVRAFRADVGNLDRLVGHRHAPHVAFPAPDRGSPGHLDHRLVEVVGGAEVELPGPLVVLPDGAPVGAGELVGPRDDRAEHGIEVEGRAEGLADLAEGLELPDRSGELAGARLQLGQQARVLDGDGRLVGEGLHQRDLAVGERADLVPVDRDHSEQLVRPQHGNREHRPDGLYLTHPRGVLGVRADVMNVDRAALQPRAPGAAPAIERDRIQVGECHELGGDVMAGDGPQNLAVEAPDDAAPGLAQPHRVLGQRLEDRLEIERRPPDHLEQLAGRGLLLERDPQLAVARLELLEQAHVLDGDHGLVAEGLQELDMAGGELPRLGPLDDDDSDRGAVGSNHRDAEQTPPLSLDRHVLRVLRVGQQVRDLRHGSVQDRPPRHLRPGRRHRVRRAAAPRAPRGADRDAPPDGEGPHRTDTGRRCGRRTAAPRSARSS